jgi:hypothetical protein
MATIKNPRQYVVADLRRRIKSAKLQEGLNIIETSEDRVTLAARVRRGKIVDYEFFDADGKNIPGTLVREPVTTTTRGTAALAAVAPVEDVTCFFCRKIKGSLVCIEVPCSSGPRL